MNVMTGNYRPAAMKASDADRDAVVSELSEHFQAGRLDADEFEERTGQALAARTWGELGQLVADLPGDRTAPRAPSAAAGTRPEPAPGRTRPPLVTVLAGLGIAAVVLGIISHGWGLIWLLIPALLIARRSACHHGAARDDR